MRTTISILLAFLFLTSCIQHGEKYSAENFNLYVKGELSPEKAKKILTILKTNKYFADAKKEISWQIVVKSKKIRLHIIAPKKIKELEISHELKFDMNELKNTISNELNNEYQVEIFFTDRQFKPVVAI